MEKIIQQKVIDELYEIEFFYDPSDVYMAGQWLEAIEFIDDYCACAPSDMNDTVEWLHRIPIPEAVKFCAEAWGISYQLRKTTTIEELIE